MGIFTHLGRYDNIYLKVSLSMELWLLSILTKTAEIILLYQYMT